jgi:pantoate--beta-alanine ligase
MSKPVILETISALRQWRAERRAKGRRVGLVPTMGALHSGHLSLAEAIRKHVDCVVFSIFVNPTQFAPHEDFSRYPRPFGEDVAKLASIGVEAVYAPRAEEMYPTGFATSVEPGGAGKVGLEDVFRPTHFAGVATVVTKLLMQAMPDAAIFGEKDYQQLAVIRQVVRDLDIPVEIMAGATMRQVDGLALSSRNVYLSPEHRAMASLLHTVMREIAADLRAGRRDYAALESAGAEQLTRAGFAVDYLAICDSITLEHPVPEAQPAQLRILVAAKLGKTRLIDNIAAG